MSSETITALIAIGLSVLFPLLGYYANGRVLEQRTKRLEEDNAKCQERMDRIQSDHTSAIGSIHQKIDESRNDLANMISGVGERVAELKGYIDAVKK